MSAVVLVLDLVGLILAALYPDAPYQTPLTNGMRGFGDHCKDFFINFKKAAFRLHSQLKKKVEEVRKKHLQGDDEEAKEAIMDEKSDADHADETSKVTPRVLNKEGVLMDVLNGNSVGWLLQNTMDPDTALVAANAITLLASPNFDVEILLRLESLFSSCFKDSGWNSVLLKEGEREKAMVYGRALCHIIGSSPSEQREEGKTQFMKRLQKLHRTSAVVHRISYASRARDSELEMLDRIIHGFLELEPSAWRYNPSIKTSGGPFLGIKSWRTSQEVPHWILHLLLKHVDERSKQGDLGQEESLSFAVFLGSFLRRKPLPPVLNVSTIALILTVLLGGTLDDGTQQQVLRIDRR
ncbi:hypothetical protein FRC03_007863 [Tulasnella sp. 419]|nr:hypothetical protein FRC03_007863 [Tulasnella sp. 419]